MPGLVGVGRPRAYVGWYVIENEGQHDGDKSDDESPSIILTIYINSSKRNSIAYLVCKINRVHGKHDGNSV